MSSLKMTFSLASLVLMVALVFCMTADAEENARNTAVSIGDAVTVPANGFAIIANVGQGADMSGVLAGTADESHVGTDNYQIAAGLPDLVTFFAKGGSISLLGPKAVAAAGGNPAVPAAEKRSVVISEIMWGRDTSGTSVADYSDKQWIELYNTSDEDIMFTLTTDTPGADGWALVFTEGRPVPDTGDDLSGTVDGAGDDDPKIPDRDKMVLVDQMSNVDVSGWVVDLGQSGNTPAGESAKDLISMYRKLDYPKIEKTHDAKDVKKNREAQLGGFPNGNVKGGWAVSNAADTYSPRLVGSPGGKHFIGLSIVGPTVPTYGVVINEIGNSTNDDHDWVELRNTGDGEVNLKKWQLRQITGVKVKKVLVEFPNNDNHKIPGKGILLIVKTDPYNDPDHPLAAGARINGAHLDTTATASRYYVGSDLALADKDKSLLLLRSRNDGGDHEGIVDFTGTLFIEDNTAGFSTEVWPLKATTKGNDNNGHGDVVKGAEEDFRSGRVYQRINAGRGTGKEVWEKRGYTGIGYKRGASDNAQNGGTPGFDNGAIKEYNDKDATVSAAPVTISEIMYETGRNLPQWFELYNSSVTQAVTINEWKVTFENADDVGIRTPAVTTEKLPGMVILPNQTLLVVSTTTGRSSGDFPKARIVDLWLSDKDTFEVETVGRRYKLLSTEAFRITVMDKAGKVVDTAGNMGADGAAMWALPASEDGAGRSSIIRRYDEGVARDGTMPAWSGEGSLGKEVGGEGNASWVLASSSNLSFIARETYYGSPDDEGTPGYRAGGALPVSLSKFRPERLDSGAVVIRWITESELNNAGFNILRSETRDGAFTKLNTNLIAGQGTISERTVYEYADISAKPNVVYYYQIQDVSLDGQVQTLRQSRIKGDISADGKITTIWAEIKTLHE